MGFVIFLVVVEFCAYFVKGIAGFGDPLISQPMLSLTQMSPSEIGPMNLLLNQPMNLYMAYTNRKSFSIKKTIPMIVFILIGLVPGIICLKYASSWILKAVLGLVILFIGIEMLTRKESASSKKNPVIMALVALVSGFSAGLFGIGIFFVAYIERTGYVDRRQFRGQMCFIFLIEGTARLLLYIIAGLYTPSILRTAVIAAIAGFAGLFCGSRVDTRLSEAMVKKIIIIVFMCAGLSAFIWAVASAF